MGGAGSGRWARRPTLVQEARKIKVEKHKLKMKKDKLKVKTDKLNVETDKLKVETDMLKAADKLKFDNFRNFLDPSLEYFRNTATIAFESLRVQGILTCTLASDEWLCLEKMIYCYSTGFYV